MLRIEPEPWRVMLDHARSSFPRECCGIMVGAQANGASQVTLAVPCRNVFEGERNDRFEIDPRDYAAAERRADEQGAQVLGFFHSHPNEDSYFSQTDLKNSWPWFSNVVLSIRDGEFNRARSFIAHLDQTGYDEEELHYPEK